MVPRQLSVTANLAASGRTGTVLVAGSSVNVTQAGSTCALTLSATGASNPATANTGSVGVTAAGGCGWTAIRNVPWIIITLGPSGTGNGTVGYSVAANPSSSQRVGSAIIGGQAFTVTQAGATCTFTLSEASASFPAAGGTNSVGVMSPGGCAWIATSSIAWLTIPSGTSGSGNGTVGYWVAANTSTSQRSGTLTIADQTFAVTQNGMVSTPPFAMVGIFRAGLWPQDYNGNGVWDGPPADRIINLGQAGDIPVVGDWNGDGRDKIGVFRNGTWIIDYDGDGVFTAMTWLIGQAGDIPVVGDWNGGGRSKIGIFEMACGWRTTTVTASGMVP